MRKKIFYWLGREFVELSGEARSAATVEEETQDLFRRFAEALKELDLCLENTVRTRIWGRTREARNLAASERTRILSGSARASSSSYVSPYHFDSDANVGLDLIAMRPLKPGVERKHVEFEPPRAYLRYLRYDSIVFVSGFCSTADRLETQVREILVDIERSLDAAGTTFDKLVRLSMFLHRSQRPEVAKAILEDRSRFWTSEVEFGFVDGFASENRLIEIEATAVT